MIIVNENLNENCKRGVFLFRNEMIFTLEQVSVITRLQPKSEAQY